MNIALLPFPHSARWLLALGTCLAAGVVARPASPEIAPARGGAWPPGEIRATRGNGFLLERQGDRYRMFELTAESRLPIGGGEIRDGWLTHGGAPVLPWADFVAQSDRLRSLPARRVTGYTADPVRVFETFWATVDENFALFDLLPRGAWRREYARFRPRVHARTTPAELWAIFAEMIRPLHDGHTRLLDPATGAVAVSRDPSPSAWMLDEAAPAYVAAIIGALDSFDPAQNVLGANAGIHGTIGGRVGYLNLFAFEDFAAAATARPGPRPSPETPDAAVSILTSLAGYQAENAPFAAALDRVFAGFAGLDALILDLRFNQGGSGDLVVELAHRLTDRPRVAYTYRVRHGGPADFEPAVAVRTAPKAPGFRGRPVVVLTSNNTLSAGDLAALVLRDLPNVRIVGETTYGIFSEGIPRQIPLRIGDAPSGWVLTVSTQRIRSARGDFLEQRGVPADLPLAADRAAIEAGRDNQLAFALAYLASLAGETAAP